jgi:hypothetical protein
MPQYDVKIIHRVLGTREDIRVRAHSKEEAERQVLREAGGPILIVRTKPVNLKQARSMK